MNDHPPNASTKFRNRDNPITSDEVRAWFGTTVKGQLRKQRYAGIAKALNGFQWATDPPIVEELTTPVPEDDRFWDFAAADQAAETLLESVPKMLAFWKGLQWAPETRAGCQIIRDLERSLNAAAPLIKHPFGPPGPRTPRVGTKDWHIAAVLIANIVLEALLETGQSSPSIARNSIAVRVVHNALKRLGFRRANMVTSAAVAMHLGRWNDQFGLVIRTI
jgi:hypothetical protein